MLISLKFIISDRLPKISYLTTLDRYLHTSYFVMILLISHVCLAQMKWKLTSSTLSLEFPWFADIIKFDYEGYLATLLFIIWTGIHLSMLNWLPLSFLKYFSSK